MGAEIKEKKYLNTKEVMIKLGVGRNFLTTYKSDLKPGKALNGKHNLYDEEIVEAFLKKRLEANPSIIQQ